MVQNMVYLGECSMSTCKNVYLADIGRIVQLMLIRPTWMIL